MAKTRRRRPETLEQAFGQVLLSYRETKALSQMDLAVATGYSLRYIGDIERGTKSATMRTMNDLATLLGINLATLILEAEELLVSTRKERSRTVYSRGRKSAAQGTKG